MSGGSRPPVPGLIPLAALSRRPGRPRRRPESIDADGGPETRAAAPGRRRHHRRRASAAVGKQSRSSSPALDRPPRVNPIFVWVRQENTRIVDVKCEDYDKRNRILLTKTPHGWRAIPRTEMLAAPRASADEDSSPAHTTHGHHHRHHHKRRSRKSKGQQHSTSVQFPESEQASEPSWVTTESVNIESLLPSHTIKRIPSPEDLPKSVNIASEQDFARTIPECSTPDKVCDVSPLDNLLAVAELELKQHMQSGNWNPHPEEHSKDSTSNNTKLNSPEVHEELTNSEAKSEGCSYNDDDEMSMNDILSRLEQSLQSPHGFDSESAFDDEMLEDHCIKDFSTSEESNKASNEEPTNLRETFNLDLKHEENTQEITDTPESDLYDHKTPQEGPKDMAVEESIDTEGEYDDAVESNADLDDQAKPEKEIKTTPVEETEIKINSPKPEETDLNITSSLQNEVAEAESSTTPEQESESDEGICLDLTIKTTQKNENKPTLEDAGPTDLRIRRRDSSPRMQPPRPASQSSEAIQSPQPSGIPAIPASPDLVSTTSTISKPRSAFLESLLATSLSKLSSNLDPALTKAKEPLDLGESRKSASPTVTCSEEIVTDLEPPTKKIKTDITLKTLLDKEVETVKKQSSKDHGVLPDTPRLLSLLNASSETEDPLTEYKQLLLEIDIPNPLMVPKDVFPDLLRHPRREILKILSGHTNKNVPLDDILVIYKDKLLGAIKSSHSNVTKKSTERVPHRPKTNEPNNNQEKSAEKRKNDAAAPKHHQTDNKTSLANDIDAANEAAFNPLLWPGFPNPFDHMGGYPNHNELFQALYAASSLPYMPAQLRELHPSLQMMLGNKMPSPLGFPPMPPIAFNNPIELSMWQEAMMQASMLKNKSPYESSTIPQQHRPSQKKPQGHSQQQSKYNSQPSNGYSKSQQPQPHPAFSHAALSSQNWQNPYLGLGGIPQNGLSVDTQFNPFSHKNISSTSRSNPQLSPSVLQRKTRDGMMLSQYNEQEKRLHQQIMQDHQKVQQMQQQKLLRQHQQQQLYQQQQQQILMQNGSRPMVSPLSKKSGSFSFGMQEKSGGETHKQAPIDLSGVHVQTKKGSGKSNGIVTSSSMRMEDVPEVGSTTGSIEDIQDGHSQLWHPLFGSQNKGYNPWALPSLAAMGE
ncbi:MOG interacting and ectopic P-granules protein 1-like [Euwallacea fornicatus]|uniref:MOG interacting and ectopic P-granules protein 1-like n=1 Tax=Euwallacea fornicatus TaxID=995702 RepID=UPI00338D5CBA